MKKTIDVKLKWVEFDTDGNVDDMIQKLQWFKDQAAARGAECWINKETEYGRYGENDRTIWQIYDRRLETDEEYAFRVKTEEVFKATQLENKRRQLEALKKELGE